jgi:hypothetical protein
VPGSRCCWPSQGAERSAAQSRLTLVAIGALTTIPLVMILLVRRRHVQG